jgi:hypothetical protein
MISCIVDPARSIERFAYLLIGEIAEILEAFVLPASEELFRLPKRYDCPATISK